MAAKRRTMLVASIALPFFPVKRKTAYLGKAYFARFHTGSVRLFALPCGRRKKFLPYIYYPVNQR